MKLLVCVALFTSAASAQIVQGFVRDARGQTIVGVTISLQPSSGGQHVTSRTDLAGSYKFEAVHEGNYTLKAEASGYATADSAIFVLARNESKKIDFTLKPLEAEFFDQPNFIVAGVTNTTAHGGHGSDTVLRSTEALAKATASLGDVAEKQQDALETLRRFQSAAQLDPSEPNYFNWASELLIHRATSPAIEVFSKGTHLFPHSTRMILGLAVAWYANGSDDKAQQSFFAACDLNPADPLPYLFLGKVQIATITHSDGYLARLERFAQLQPENASANYHYAASLWNQRDSETAVKVQALLEKAIRLDPHLSAAYLLLGTLYSERKDSRNAIAAFQKADLEEAHYRLAQEYRKIGDNERAEQEIAIYNELSRKSAEQAEKERVEIQQFVFSLR